MIGCCEVGLDRHDPADLPELLRRKAPAIIGHELLRRDVVKNPCFATSAAEKPFIVITLVIFECRSVITRRYSFYRAVRINGTNISMHTDFNGSKIVFLVVSVQLQLNFEKL